MNKNISLIGILVISICIQTSIHADAVIGKSGMVVTAHAIASEFGVEILKSGGNAIDAAVGAAIILGVVEPYASGFGGGGGMLIYLQEKDSLTFINYYACAPEHFPEKPDTREESSGASTVLVPGTVAGLHYALLHYGTIAWSDLLQRAIDKLQTGILVDGNLNKFILDSYEKLTLHPQTSAIYLVDDFPPEEGTIIQNKRMLACLEKLAQEGPAAFYQGAIADSIEKEMVEHGGALRKSDLMNYCVKEVKPITSTYRGYQLWSAPPPFSGATVLETLNILEFQELSVADDFVQNPATFHLMAEALNCAYADRQQYLGDPDFFDVPLTALLSKEFARARFQTIDLQKVNPATKKEFPAGDVTPFLHYDPLEKGDKDGNTSQISVVDEQGNAVSLTQTLNYFWGSGISVCGFLLNNGMTSFSTNPANRIAAGKQPRTTIAPTIAFQPDGKLNMVIGTPGAGRIISTMVQVLCNVLDFQQSADDANRAPRFYCRNTTNKITVEARFSQELSDKVKSMGHDIETLGEMDLYFGGVQLIMVDPNLKQLIGSSDPRRSGVAAGY